MEQVPRMRFVDKVAVVTGGGSGVGRATALRLALEGATVFAVDIDPGVREFDSQAGPGGGSVQGIAADLTDPDQTARLAEQVRVAGQVDVLVNSAGVFELGSIEELELDSWNRQIAANLSTTFLVSRSLLPLIKRSSGGSIVNLSSIAGIVSFPRNAAYSASKSAIVGLTRSMAIDLAADGIRTNCVCPYSVEGSMMERYFRQQEDPEASRQFIADSTPLGRLARIDEVVNAILFLASSEASYITGVALAVDGGFTAR